MIKMADYNRMYGNRPGSFADLNNPPRKKRNMRGVLVDATILAALVLALVVNIRSGVSPFLVFSGPINNKPYPVSQVNAKITIFQKLFIDKVLNAQGPVSQEDRLALEKAAADTNDQNIISQWHNFLNSKTETDAQKNVLILLSILANKVSQ